jgi:hypothetical protein
MNLFNTYINSYGQIYKEINIPTKVLKINPFLLPEVFEGLDFNESFKKSLEKIIVD